MSHELLKSNGPAQPRGVVLMLHGGTAHSSEPVGPRSGSWRRMRLMYAAIESRVVDSGSALWLLRFTMKGWNEGEGLLSSPVPDARWALDQIHEEYAGLPLVLLGHSMGGRTAVNVADDPSVIGVVALAPWLPASESVAPLTGRRLVAAHGSRDRITSAQQTRAFVRRAAAVAESAEFVDMGFRGHYMLSGVRAWNRQALRSTLSMLGATRA